MYRRGHNFMELSCPRHGNAGDYKQENTCAEVCNSFHCHNHPSTSFPATRDHCTTPDARKIPITWLNLVICLYRCNGIAKVGTQNKGDTAQKLRLYAKSCSKMAYSFATSAMWGEELPGYARLDLVKIIGEAIAVSIMQKRTVPQLHQDGHWTVWSSIRQKL